MLLTSCIFDRSEKIIKKPFRVLVVFSYEKKCEWTQEQYKGIINCLEEHKIDAKIDSFHLNADWLSKEQEIDTLTRMLKQYENNPPHLIITCDDQATYSLQATQHPLSYQVPIVFCGVDYVDYKIMENRNNITGFTTEPNYKKCYKLAQQLFGHIGALHIIAEPTFLGRKGVEELCKQLNEIPNLKYINEIVERDSIHTSSFDTLYVNPNTIKDPLTLKIIWLNRMDGRRMKWLLRDQPNVVTIMPRWSSLYSGIARMDNIPLLIVSEEGIGDGRLGGYITSSYEATYQATETGIHILKGKINPDTIPVTHSKMTPTFDWRQLEYWKIGIDKLPTDSVIINTPFIVKNKNTLWISGVCLGSFILFLILAFDQLYKREKINKKKILNTLIKEQNELNITMESISEGVISIDEQGLIIDINQAALNWMELDGTREDYAKKTLRSILDIRQINNSQYLDYLFSKISQTYGNYVFGPSTYLVTASSLSFPISGSIAAIYFDKEWKGAIITFRNMTNEMTQKKLLALITTTGDVFVWKYNYTKRLFTYDNAFFRFMQWPENETGELTSNTILPFLHPDDQPIWEKAIQTLITGKVHHYIVQVRLKTGSGVFCWWEYRIVPQPNQETGKIIDFFGICLNIDYLKKKEKELEEIRDIALEADRQKTLFLSNMSHEIRTPLNAIVGFSCLLLEPDELTDTDKQEFINIINENCRLLLNLVNDILDISRIESGITFKHEVCELNSLVNSISEEYKEITEKHILIKTDLPDTSFMILSDKFRIRQVLSNLLNNAIKFTDEGSITIGYHVNTITHSVCFFIRDTGRGISKKEHAKIFERFYKSDNFTQGGGLGLPICQEIVRRMHGDITFESELGKGTCFYITLPHDTALATKPNNYNNEKTPL